MFGGRRHKLRTCESVTLSYHAKGKEEKRTFGVGHVFEIWTTQEGLNPGAEALVALRNETLTTLAEGIRSDIIYTPLTVKCAVLERP